MCKNIWNEADNDILEGFNNFHKCIACNGVPQVFTKPDSNASALYNKRQLKKTAVQSPFLNSTKMRATQMAITNFSGKFL